MKSAGCRPTPPITQGLLSRSPIDGPITGAVPVPCQVRRRTLVHFGSAAQAELIGGRIVGSPKHEYSVTPIVTPNLRHAKKLDYHWAFLSVL
jgi:hypothetical protein